MDSYDYKAGKKRVKEILDNKLEVLEQSSIPADDKFTFLFSNQDKEKVSKIIRSFTSEVIEILRDDVNLREIGIRGDCVYAVYSTPKQDDIYEIMDKTWYINTYMMMLTALLKEKRYPAISVGIGMATAKELVVKAGRKDVGINNKVWIGDAVAKASHLSSLGNKNGRKPIVYSSLSYSNFIDKTVIQNGQESKNWFKEESTSYGTVYYADIVKPGFQKWILEGMKDD